MPRLERNPGQDSDPPITLSDKMPFEARFGEDGRARAVREPGLQEDIPCPAFPATLEQQ